MKSTIKAIAILAVALIFSQPFASSAGDGEEVVRIDLQSSVPSESVTRSSDECPIDCFYSITGQNVILASEGSECRGAVITMQNITTGVCEYSDVVASPDMFVTIPLQGRGIHSIVIVLPSGSMYHGAFSNVFETGK